MTPPDTVADAHSRYRGAVERAAARILRDREDASDVASEAFVAMLERGPQDRQAALAWLLTTARNRALNLVRDRQRAARRALMVLDEHEAPGISDDRPATLIAAAMARLSERDQAAVLLRFVNDCPQDEIAATLGVSVAASRVVVHRAIKRLRIETVRILAAHHGAQASCESRLAKLASGGIPAGHDGCAPCTSVSDEISALAAHSMIPAGAAPLLQSLTTRARDAIASMTPRVSGAESFAAEALAAVIIVTGLIAPSLPARHGVAGTPVAAQASAPRPRTAAALAAVARPAAAARPASKIGPVTVADAEGDGETLVGPPPGVTVLGKTIRLPDALDPSAGGGNDIRSFSAYTQAGKDGRPETLVFLIGMADDVGDQSSFDVTWNYAGTDCSGDVGVSTYNGASDPTAWLRSSCMTPLTDINLMESEQSSWSVDLTPRIRGTVIEITIPLRTLTDGLEKLLRPGATLTGLTALSSVAQGALFTEMDRAPDSDGITYTIGRR